MIDSPYSKFQFNLDLSKEKGLNIRGNFKTGHFETASFIQYIKNIAEMLP
jgi:hypothetical protein